MKVKIKRKEKTNYPYYYRLFNKSDSELERPNYRNILDTSEFEDVINQFFSDNRLNCIIHDNIFNDRMLKSEEIITLIGTNQFIQLNIPLYTKYRDVIEAKLIESMNYNVIREFISNDTEFILNLCSSGLIYNADDSSKIDKVYIYLLDNGGNKLIEDVFGDVLKDQDSIVQISHEEGRKVKLVCGDRILLINDKMYNLILSNNFPYQKRVSKGKMLIKK